MHDIFSLVFYSFDKSIFAEEERIKTMENLALGKSASITYNDKTAEIELGGIFPFNTVTFNGMGFWGYDICVFNGSSYETVFSSKSPHKNQIVKLDKTYNTSYKLKLVCKGREPIDPKTINIGVYET